MNGTDREQITKEILVNLMEMESPQPRPTVDSEHTTKQLVIGLVGLHERIAELDKTAEVDDREQLQKTLDKTREALEIRIAQRTEALRNLQQANQRLQTEVQRRKQIEQALRTCETQYQTLLAGSIQGVAIIGQDGRYLYANQTLLDTLGYDSLDTSLNHNVQDNLARHERMRLQTNWKALLRGDPVPTRYHYQGLRMDGTPAWIESIVTPITWDGNSALMITSQNITKQKQLEAAYIQLKAKFNQLQAATSSPPTPHANEDTGTDKFRLFGKKILRFLKLSRGTTSLQGAPEV